MKWRKERTIRRRRRETYSRNLFSLPSPSSSWVFYESEIRKRPLLSHFPLSLHLLETTQKMQKENIRIHFRYKMVVTAIAATYSCTYKSKTVRRGNGIANENDRCEMNDGSRRIDLVMGSQLLRGKCELVSSILILLGSKWTNYSGNASNYCLVRKNTFRPSIYQNVREKIGEILTSGQICESRKENFLGAKTV